MLRVQRNSEEFEGLKKRMNIFTKHPKEVGESYFQHFRVALKIAVILFCSSFFQLAHSVFPFVTPPVFARVDSLKAYFAKVSPSERKKNNLRSRGSHPIEAD